jgi:hypothetical protein
MSPSTEESLNNLSKEIQQLDNSIRFAGIANNLGSLVATAYRNGLTPLIKLKQPMVIGYIIAGMIIGPHTPPFSLLINQDILN